MGPGPRGLRAIGLLLLAAGLRLSSGTGLRLRPRLAAPSDGVPSRFRVRGGRERPGSGVPRGLLLPSRGLRAPGERRYCGGILPGLSRLSPLEKGEKDETFPATSKNLGVFPFPTRTTCRTAKRTQSSHTAALEKFTQDLSIAVTRISDAVPRRFVCLPRRRHDRGTSPAKSTTVIIVLSQTYQDSLPDPARSQVRSAGVLYTSPVPRRGVSAARSAARFRHLQKNL